MDVDVKITGPDSKSIYSGERESNGKYTFAAHIDGTYTFCLGNKMSTMTPKVVMFNIEVGNAPSDIKEDTTEEHSKLGIESKRSSARKLFFASLTVRKGLTCVFRTNDFRAERGDDGCEARARLYGGA